MAFNKNKVMDAARRFVEKGQTDKAIKEYLKVVDHDPKDVRVWLKIGDLYAKKGAKQDATDTYLKVAKFYSEQGFYLKAVAVYKQILKLDPRLVEVNLKLAELYRQLGLLSDAMQHFERVAAFFHREGKTKEALATIRQLVDLDPDNVATRIKLAELYSKEEMTKEAITEFRHACEYLRQHNRQDDFIKVAERLLWHDPNDMPLNRELATLYLRRNDPRRALQKLQTCFKADARDVETLALLAQAFQALDQKSKTVSVLKELARILTENGQNQQASEVHHKILMYVPDDPDSLEATGQRPAAAQFHSPEPAPAPAPSTTERVGLGTGEMRAYRQQSGPNVTGSIPIVTESPEPSRSSASRAPSSPRYRAPVVEQAEDFAADIAIDDESFEVSSVTGEAHADEIVKILTETDVYVKYGLAQKALDHIQRVFELDPQNVEARDRLKEIYLSLQQPDRAAQELVTLAEIVAPQNPGRAEGYLIEAANLDPRNAGIQRVAQAHRLDVTPSPDLEIIDDLSDSIELDADDIGTGLVTPVDDIELDEFDGTTSSPPFDPEPTGNPTDVGDPVYDTVDRSGDDFEFELEDYGDGGAHEGTMEVAVNEVVEEVALDADDGDELHFGSSAPAPESTAELALDDLEFEEISSVEDIGMIESVALDAPDHLPDDEDLTLAPPGPASFPDPVALAADSLDDLGGLGDNFELPSEVLPASPLDDGFGTAEQFEPEAAPEQVTPAPSSQTATGPAVEPVRSSTTNLEDDLDEADFFVAQSLFDEARDILHGLLSTYPNHPLIMAKLQDVAALEAGEAPPLLDDEPLQPDPLAALDSPTVHETGTPSVMLERPVDDEDADTHFDLGLAYKEMGLWDEAIKAFLKVIDRPERAVECNLMIGLCYREQAALGEAVQQFKTGLYVEGITDAQKMMLYYEIGAVYELMNDPGEAMYFFEMVLKKDPGHRDITDRVAKLRSAANGNGAHGSKKKIELDDDDIDAAFDAQHIHGGDASRR